MRCDLRSRLSHQGWAPYGEVDVWKTTIYSYEFPLIAAQSYVYGYELTVDDRGDADPELRTRRRFLEQSMLSTAAPWPFPPLAP